MSCSIATQLDIQRPISCLLPITYSIQQQNNINNKVTTEIGGDTFSCLPWYFRKLSVKYDLDWCGFLTRHRGSRRAIICFSQSNNLIYLGSVVLLVASTWRPVAACWQHIFPWFRGRSEHLRIPALHFHGWNIGEGAWRRAGAREDVGGVSNPSTACASGPLSTPGPVCGREELPPAAARRETTGGYSLQERKQLLCLV